MEKRRTSDGFARTAISFVLGTILGFSLFLLGFVFFGLGILGSTTDSGNLSPIVWVILGIISSAVGFLLMRYNLNTGPNYHK
ncbi:MAG: hypothetical protein INQ03_25280 [Candidatus Heimdallarchaeota archaeon]|nr:hypothetical protein [Candidatus Heimdallarchaeota archaeon]